MIPQVIEQWEKRKHLLEEHFRNGFLDDFDEYEKIVRLLFDIVITEVPNAEYKDWCLDKMTVVDQGDYGGTRIYIIPTDTYQPDMDDYIIMNNYYGSCSGCDTLQGIIGWPSEGKPSEDQVKGLMTIALHLVQSAKILNE